MAANGVVDNSQAVLDALTTNLVKGLQMCGLVGEAHAKALCPVDTGRLRNSISHAHDISKKEAQIGTNVEYAPYVELGTRKPKREPKYFLKHAAEDHTDEYKSILENALKGK